MYPSIKKTLVLLSMVGLLASLQACEDASSTSGGGGTAPQLVDLTDTSSVENESNTGNATGGEAKAVASVSSDGSKAATEVTPDTEPSPAEIATDEIQTAAATEVRTEPRGEFHILIDQSHMACHSCGLNFDSAELIIDHSAGRYKHFQGGGLYIKLGPYRQARFRADLSSIPPEAEIIKATLHMRLNTHEGHANADNESEFVVKGYVKGSLIHIKDFDMRNDIRGRGYQKAMNPVVPFDYTRYAKML